MKKLFGYIIPLILLAGIVLFCFHRTLTSYFLADDFGQIAYASKICKGNINALLANFTGNYMQIPVMKIYRPCLLLSFVFDYLLWQTNAFGYFLSNILAMIATTLMLYFLLRELTRYWDEKRSATFALFSSALFAANPLHCESVSFVSGRDNIFSAFFYLLTLWCFTRKGKTKNTTLLILGIASFWVSLFFKETAIGLPIVLTAIVFFLPFLFRPVALSTGAETANKYNAKGRVLLAWNETMPIWIGTGVYFIVRYLALGTFTGGYIGGLGSSLMASSWSRWESIDTLLRLMFPLNAAIFSAWSYLYIPVLLMLYSILMAITLIKIMSNKYVVNLLGLFFIWILSVAVPVYQLWGLGENLEGSRFFFFLSIPLSIFFPLLIFSPTGELFIFQKKEKSAPVIEIKRMEALALVTLIALVMLDANITYSNNIPWVHAGKQTKACLTQAQKLARLAPPKTKLAIIMLPYEKDGAHIIYNGATFNTMMSPPFSKEDYSGRFITFDPIFYSPLGIINSHRLRSALSDPHLHALLNWDGQSLVFKKLDLPSIEALTNTKTAGAIDLKNTDQLTVNVTSNHGLLHHIIHKDGLCKAGLFLASHICNPYEYDFLELTLKSHFPKELMFVSWQGDSNDLGQDHNSFEQFVTTGAAPTKVRIRLSNHWQWYTQGNIDRLQLEFVPGQLANISNMQLVSSKNLVPQIDVSGIEPTNMGVYPIKQNGVWLYCNARTVNGCTAIKIDVLKPNYFVEGVTPNEESDSIMKTLVEPSNNGQLFITRDNFKSAAYYQLGASCLDKNGNVIGEKSDPITIQVLD